MFKSYFLTAWRNLLKSKTSSFINISGLAVGMAVAILIGLWIWDELSYNKSFDNYNRIAQVITLTTVSFQAIKAAIANPVKSLRAE